MMQDEKAANSINITPLVDVCLCLVLFFMVTAPFSNIYGINVRNLTLKKYGLTTPQESVSVRLTDNGIYIQNEKGEDVRIAYKEFGVVLRQMLQISPTKNFLIRVDRNVPHGQTVWALDLAKQNGALEVSILEGNKNG